MNSEQVEQWLLEGVIRSRFCVVFGNEEAKNSFMFKYRALREKMGIDRKKDQSVFIVKGEEIPEENGIYMPVMLHSSAHEGSVSILESMGKDVNS